MPTRYLKPGIRDSDRIEMLSDCPDAECLYTRLLVTVDDFGRFDGRPEMIKAHCFPIRSRATARTCMQWLERLVSADLIILYVVDDKRYLQIKRWDNKPRASESKYPEVPIGAHKCMQDTHNCMQMLPVTETVTETKTDTTLSGKPDESAKRIRSQAREILEYLNANTKRAYRPVDSNLKLIEARLRSGATPLQCREVIFAKCMQWATDPKMSEYLRPATLFNATKFEQYLGENNAMS